ncbi:MAG: alpha/beta hydrolase [Planctomycetaceae bacterium]
MDGVFRYGKGIAASLILSAVAFAFRYGEHWLFPSVEQTHPSAAVVWLNDSGHDTAARSPQRNDAGGIPQWRVAVVTNRAIDDAVAVHDPVTSANTLPPTSRTLAQQASDLFYSMPETAYGSAIVTVPKNRRRGSCEISDEHINSVSVGRLELTDAKDFLTNLTLQQANSETQDVLVFVHGFNVQLDEAIARAAQVAEDLPLHGIVIAFSWQSKARTEAYLSDERQAERYFWSLADLLFQLRSAFPEDTRLHLLAHSMGNRVALRALNALAGTIDPTGRETDLFARARLESGRSAFSPAASGLRSGVLDGQEEMQDRFPEWGAWSIGRLRKPALASLVMAAPDVDTAEYQTFVGNIRHLCGQMVLYASDSDYALETSRRVHEGGYRAGDSRARLSVPGLQIVRVSGVSSADPLGHSYYGSHPEVLDQLAVLFRAPIDLNRPISEVAASQQRGLR